jgi:hypothetical protein
MDTFVYFRYIMDNSKELTIQFFDRKGAIFVLRDIYMYFHRCHHHHHHHLMDSSIQMNYILLHSTDTHTYIYIHNLTLILSSLSYHIRFY